MGLRNELGTSSFRIVSAARLALCAVFLISVASLTRGQSVPVPPSEPAPADATGTGIISGTVVNPNGSVVEGAHVMLTQNGHQIAILRSGGDGQFVFSGLPAGRFTITVTGNGLGTASSPEIALSPGGIRYLSAIVVPLVAATTSVRVTANQDAIAEREVHIEEGQRVLGVIPNFYTSFDWSAPPMNAKQKFQLAWRSFIDPTTFIEAGLIAGGEQIENLYPGFGTGAPGFGKRYGAALANTFDSRFLGDALFPAIFHQDPRYFYKEHGDFGSKALYAMEQAVMTRGSNGHQQFDYSRIAANFAAGGLSNLYYSAANRGASLPLRMGPLRSAARRRRICYGSLCCHGSPGTHRTPTLEHRNALAASVENLAR